MNWPDATIEALSKFARARTVPLAAATGQVPEMWLWISCGQARLDRGEYHSALAAFKRSETMAADGLVREGLALAQARVLLLLGQPKPATAMLAAISDRKASPHANSALAILGAMKLADGAADQALMLLRRSVEESPTEFPGRAEAEADLGLAYLSVNRESEGLRWLASAQQRFRTLGEFEQLVRCLENEALYWESRGRRQEADTARGKALDLERTAR